MKNKIKKLGFKLKIPTKEEYFQYENSYIADYEEYKGGFFGGYQKNPEVGRAEWDKMYPQGHKDWLAERGDRLTTTGIQIIVNKIDEIIDFINKFKEQPK